jgi:hypothetical protein
MSESALAPVEASQQGSALVYANPVWGKIIPRTNKGFGVVYIAFLVLDGIVVAFMPALAAFLIPMAGVMLIFWLFLRFENAALKNRFASSKSPLDGLIFAIIVIRNFVFLLNIIPVIQLLGLSLLSGLVTFPLALIGSGGDVGLGKLGEIIPSDGGVSLAGAAPWLILIVYIVLVWLRYRGTPKSVQ